MADSATIDAPRVLNPSELIIEANVRSETKLTKEFISSIKQHGILNPVIVESVDGTWHVLDGQRRVLAAIQLDLAEIPVHVVDRTTDSGHLIAQLVVNDQREALTEAEHTATYRQLALIGVSADQIARKTNTPKKRIETALRVAESSHASEVLATGNVTLDQAAAIVEFEDSPEVVEYLTTVAVENPTGFDHAVARATDERQQAEALAGLRTELEAAGWLVFDDEPDKGARVRDLYESVEKRKAYTSLAHAGHEQCPGRAAVMYISQSWNGTGYDRVPAHYEICTDWEANDHIPSWQSGAGSGANGGGLTEEQKAERKLTRENNKLWGPATEVRLAFVKNLLQQKEPPLGWEQFVARFVVAHRYSREPAYAAQLLGEHVKSHGEERWIKDNPTKAIPFMIAMAIAAIENSFEFAKSGWRREEAPAYLAQLSKWGYNLSELEETVAKEASK